jgi:O-antigen/teichoic acid export membrane protein
MLNYGIMLVSPIFLTRIFDLHAYGQYQEFMLYAMLIAGIIEFSMNTNLIYFVPRYPERERQSVTHTAILLLVTTSIGLTIVFLLRRFILARTSYDFIAPLIAYIFFFLNFELFENYWLGKKRTDYVLFYSSIRIIVRTAALIMAAFLSRDVQVVIYTLIGVEIVKCIVVLVLLRKILTRDLDLGLLKEQLKFIIPLGSAVTINLVNSQLANLFISIKLGVESLAQYSIGSRQIPIINIVRSSVMDVLFPEMTQRGDAERLHLWQRATIVFCFVVFPVYVVFFFYAPVFIETLFTSNYANAIPLFRIYLTLLLLNCFDMGTPLRSINQNKYFIFGSALKLSINIGLILTLYRSIGFVLPAFAFIAAELAACLFLASMIIRHYRIRLGDLFPWKKILAILCCAAAAVPVLFAGIWANLPPLAKAVSFSLLYLCIYFIAVRRFKIDEIELLVEKAVSVFRRS